MTIDRSKLRNDVKRLSKGEGALRRPTITAEIRDLLPEIERLRSEDRAPWKVIAQALAEQGVTEGAGQRPLSERRLTSIVTKLKAKKMARAVDARDRGARVDVAKDATSGPSLLADKTKPRLAIALTAPSEDASEELPLSENEIRRMQREKHAHLIKKD